MSFPKITFTITIKHENFGEKHESICKILQ